MLLGSKWGASPTFSWHAGLVTSTLAHYLVIIPLLHYWTSIHCRLLQLFLFFFIRFNLDIPISSHLNWCSLVDILHEIAKEDEEKQKKVRKIKFAYMLVTLELDNVFLLRLEANDVQRFFMGYLNLICSLHGCCTMDVQNLCTTIFKYIC